MNFLLLFFVIFIGAIVVYAVMDYAVKNADNRKPLQRRYGKVLEKKQKKMTEATHIEQIVFECESGERLKLNNVYPDKILISVGDAGHMEYRGETVQKFQREK